MQNMLETDGNIDIPPVQSFDSFETKIVLRGKKSIFAFRHSFCHKYKVVINRNTA